MLDADLKEFPRQCENCSLNQNEYINATIQDMQAEIAELRELFTDLEDEADTLYDTIEGLADAPSEALLAETNFVAVGTADALVTFPRHCNQNFATVVDPVFLWRYRDCFLFELKLDMRLRDCDTDIEMVYGVFDWVVNRYLTVRAGKFSLPLGIV